MYIVQLLKDRTDTVVRYRVFSFLSSEYPKRCPFCSSLECRYLTVVSTTSDSADRYKQAAKNSLSRLNVERVSIDGQHC